jgi:hypothetical protein
MQAWRGAIGISSMGTKTKASSIAARSTYFKFSVEGAIDISYYFEYRVRMEGGDIVLYFEY